jgi:hypothetical protein
VRLEVLNKSAIVLLTAFWEAYCEDVAGEALEYIVRHTKDAGGLPQDLRKAVAKELKEEPHELAVWRLADTGWRTELASRLTALKEKRDRQLNTPKTQQNRRSIQAGAWDLRPAEELALAANVRSAGWREA